MADPAGKLLKEPGPFVPFDPMRRPDAASTPNFAARHFAAKRAGFLLREHRRQQAAPPADAAPAAANGDAVTDVQAVERMPEPAGALASAPGIPPEEVERRVAEAERRGRDEGQAALAAALDQAIAALDAAGRAVAEAHRDLERRWVVPLAQASLHIGSELARQVLTAPAGLQRYLETVTAAIGADGADPRSDAVAIPIQVRLNPEDLAVLENASIRPSVIKLVADPLVPRSGAIASSDDKVVDDRFENRVRFAKEAVLAAAADLLREAPS